MITVFIFGLFASSLALPLVTTNYTYPQLSENIQPSHYNLNFNLKKDWQKSDDFDGSIEIHFVIVSNSEKLVQIHASNLNIILYNLKVNNSSIECEFKKVENTEDLWSLTMENGTQFDKSNEYVLGITFSGKLREDMTGFYKSSYINENGVIQYLASTQFENSAARRAFPCFDQPQFKATFALTITYPKEYEARSNERGHSVIDDEFKITTFNQTKAKMSTYLIAFVVSKFQCDTFDEFVYVCSRNYSKDTRKLALDTLPKILNVMEEFTGHNYKSEKDILQAFAIPDFKAGAMENWGLLTYREALLLWNQEDFSQHSKQQVITVVAHETSHQWFGDLVTLKWWDDVFLNEGFATYFEYHAAQIAYEEEELELGNQFLVDMVQTALAYDSANNVAALHSSVSANPVLISERFDEISYNKGGSIFRMVEYIYGSKAFKESLTRYIASLAQNSATARLLWSSFDDIKINNETIACTKLMETWTNEPGFPLVSVNSDNNKITITQEKFNANLGSENVGWYVPLTYSDSNSPSNNEIHWLTADKSKTEIDVSLEDVDWWLLNNGLSGYYRVNYDNNLLKKITNILNQPGNNIDQLNKAQFVDDLLELAKHNKKEYNDVFDLLKFLAKENNYYTWVAAFRGFNFLQKRITKKNILNMFNDYIIKLTKTLSNENTFLADEDLAQTKHVDILNNVMSLTWDCNLSKDTCLNEAIKLFADYKTYRKKPNPNYRPIVYCAGIRGSQNILDDWNFLWNEYINTSLNTEQTIILSALGCTNNIPILNKYVDIVVEKDSKIRAQDIKFAIVSILSNSYVATDVVLDFLTSNLNKIPSYQISTWIDNVAEYIKSSDQKEKLSQLTVSSDLQRTLDEAITKVENNLQISQKLENSLISYFSNYAGRNVVNYVTIIFPFILLLHKIM